MLLDILPMVSGTLTKCGITLDMVHQQYLWLPRRTAEFFIQCCLPSGILAGGFTRRPFFLRRQWLGVFPYHQSRRYDLGGSETYWRRWEKKNSKAAGHTVIQYVEVVYKNQYGDIVAKAKGWSIRAESICPQRERQVRWHQKHIFTKAEMKLIYDTYDKEEVRGVAIRYWEDVKEGDLTYPCSQRPA